ncbi:hypothetical protein BGW39_003392 [Mortierella sp. 14UC]|nr:hypothetical protein BGW39_003392 [Mortierella sp. 14UC]
MRRVHPQRVKPPVQPQSNNTSSKPSTGNSNVNCESKAWTTHSELHKQYAANKNNNSSSNPLQQAVAQAKQAKTNPMTGRKTFAFNPSSIPQPDQSRDPNATNMDQGDGALNSNRKTHSGNGAAERDKAGASTWNKGRVVVGGYNDDDDDDDFDLPDVSELFENSLPRKLRRVENSGHTMTATEVTTSHVHGHQQTDSSLTKSRLSLTNRSHFGDKDKKQQAEEEEEDPWMMSIHIEDQDLELFPPSPTSSLGGLAAHKDTQQKQQAGAAVAAQQHQHQKHQHQKQLRQKLPLAMSTRSEVSQTQHTLNEIDRLFMDEALTRSPSKARLETPFEYDEMSGIRSPTPYVGAPNQFPLSSRDMDTSGVGDAVPFQEHQQDEEMEADITIRVDGQNDASLNLTSDGGVGHAEPSSEQKAVDPHEDQDAEVVGEKALSEVAGQANDSAASRRQTLKFTLPNSSDDFCTRLQQLSMSFQSSLDNMMDAIKDVEQFRSSVEKILTDRQDTLHQRGERIHEQARRLQDEATTLHSKGRQDMLRVVRSD